MLDPPYVQGSCISHSTAQGYTWKVCTVLDRMMNSSLFSLQHSARFPPDMKSHRCFKSALWCSFVWNHKYSSECAVWTGVGWAHFPGGLQCLALENWRCDRQPELFASPATSPFVAECGNQTLTAVLHGGDCWMLNWNQQTTVCCRFWYFSRSVKSEWRTSYKTSFSEMNKGWYIRINFLYNWFFCPYRTFILLTHFCSSLGHWASVTKHIKQQAHMLSVSSMSFHWNVQTECFYLVWMVASSWLHPTAFLFSHVMNCTKEDWRVSQSVHAVVNTKRSRSNWVMNEKRQLEKEVEALPFLPSVWIVCCDNFEKFSNTVTQSLPSNHTEIFTHFRS